MTNMMEAQIRCPECGAPWSDWNVSQCGDCGYTLECINSHTETSSCDGPVLLRESLSGTGTPIPRCEAHWQKRLAWQDRHNREYPDSETPPEWFDPTAAGEHWGSDDY